MEDKTSDFNGMTPGQKERLHLLMEECAEVIQACAKALRHGLDSHHPNNDQVTNRDFILMEMADVSAVMTMLLQAGDLPHPPTDEQIFGKLDRLKQYTHHQSWNE